VLKNKKLKETTASRKPLFHRKKSSKQQTKATPKTPTNTLPAKTGKVF
jgi:hypothetical protein